MKKLLRESLTHLNGEFESFKKGILKVENYLFTFLTNPHVPYDNWHYPNFGIMPANEG